LVLYSVDRWGDLMVVQWAQKVALWVASLVAQMAGTQAAEKVAKKADCWGGCPVESTA
jgi:hypothetical protein